MEESDLQKTVLITGGATGLGREISRKLNHASFEIAITDTAEITGDFPFFQCDLTFPMDIDQLYSWTLQTIGVPDVLILNAGVGIREKLSEGDPEKWQRVFDVNVMGALRVIRAFLPAFLERKSGHILFVSSVSEGKSHKYGGIYCASKTALGIIAETLRLETLPHICVSSLLPGATDTSFYKNHIGGEIDKPPESHLLSPSDLAEDVLYILTRKNHCINKLTARPLTQEF